MYPCVCCVACVVWLAETTFEDVSHRNKAIGIEVRLLSLPVVNKMEQAAECGADSATSPVVSCYQTINPKKFRGTCTKCKKREGAKLQSVCRTETGRFSHASAQLHFCCCSPIV
jgi:hypothetical protein